MDTYIPFVVGVATAVVFFLLFESRSFTRRPSHGFKQDLPDRMSPKSHRRLQLYVEDEQDSAVLIA